MPSSGPNIALLLIILIIGGFIGWFIWRQFGLDPLFYSQPEPIQQVQ